MGTSQRWWTQSRALCPVSGFPISLLPYPPFRLRIETAQQPGQELYVDGKFLALKLVAIGNFQVCGRMLDGETVVDLEDYLRRCKLGTMQLGRALALGEMLVSLGPEAKQHIKVTDELYEIRGWAKQTLKALRRKQDCRLSRRDRDNRAFKIEKAIEVIQNLEDQPGRGAPTNNRACRLSRRERDNRGLKIANAFEVMQNLEVEPGHVPRTLESSKLYECAVPPAFTANGPKQCNSSNEASEHAIHSASSQSCRRKTFQQFVAPDFNRYGGPWHGSWRSFQEGLKPSSGVCSYDQAQSEMIFSL